MNHENDSFLLEMLTKAYETGTSNNDIKLQQMLDSIAADLETLLYSTKS
ncbi:hypothetical protein ACUXCC_000224 [Cytobacillus horneckiae]|nr:hypothetical protein [Cytobacillus horneckiae]MBN6885090.1 hypothetical protein [Cytobacillus horneckiae]MCM3179165.1 hypothetical protein [Cytobacillus horneckiae]